ncbi:MAG: hypothetical protein ACXVI9_04020 [Mucilaginibacter sp.]
MMVINNIKQALNFFALIAALYCISYANSAKAQTPAKPEIAYHLSWDGKSSYLKVRLDYTPATKDSTVFIFGIDGFGGQHNTFNLVSNLKCDATDKVKTDPKTRKVTVYHANNGLRELNYQINGALLSDTSRMLYKQLFRPVIADGSLYLVSFFYMMNPVGHKAASVSIQWDAAPSNITYFLSTNPDATTASKAVIDTANTEQSMIEMSYNLQTTKYSVRGIPYYAITSTKDTVNNIKKELDPFFTRYFPSLRDYWQDNDAPYYYVSLTQILESDIPAGGGFGWGNGFIMKYAGRFDDWKKEVIAHETSHNWIGHRLSIGNDSFANQWFGEGFNDYVCILNLVKSGIFDDNSFVSFVNKYDFKPHYTSPVKNAPNDSIGKKYWIDKNYEKLPYRRGLIYAFCLDNQIQLASNGKQSLRDLLLALFKVYKQKIAADPNANLTMKDFIDQASNFLPRTQIQSEVENYMLKGNPIDLRQIKFTGYFKFDYQGDVPVLSLVPGTNLREFCKW